MSTVSGVLGSILNSIQWLNQQHLFNIKCPSWVYNSIWNLWSLSLFHRNMWHLQKGNYRAGRAVVLVLWAGCHWLYHEGCDPSKDPSAVLWIQMRQSFQPLAQTIQRKITFVFGYLENGIKWQNADHQKAVSSSYGILRTTFHRSCTINLLTRLESKKSLMSPARENEKFETFYSKLQGPKKWVNLKYWSSLLILGRWEEASNISCAKLLLCALPRQRWIEVTCL